MARSTLDRLHDELYVLGCAVDDAVRDLKLARTVPDHADIVTMLLDAARPLRSFDPLPAPIQRP